MSRWVKLGGALVVIAVLLIVKEKYIDFTADDIRDWILSFGVIAPLIYIGIYTIRPLVLFPASILSLAGGATFGALGGMLYTIIGAVLGAALSFFVARRFGKNISKDTSNERVQRIQEQLDKNGFFYVLIFRLIPLFNFDLVSYSSGLSRVRFTSFILATTIGIIPGTFAYNFLGDSVAEGDWKLIVGAVLFFVAVSVIPLFFRKKFQQSDLKGDKSIE
ncbi:TVP38/TMEM64 family protein [Bacillus solimangrovi]|uniref:TVP38/TMEM64 family membrane protein n=1 Tax=Bacillus solimangrovi TaxID=1305675 RepID=A0A1E5LDR1_9BACI|nr:TVP38/TMEM64 family protein [Bacillus solimangrovi]OEH92225.1 SNARE associated Golgi family protein [Bacillus solimangrovi]